MERVSVSLLLGATAAAVFLLGFRESIDDWFPMRVGDRWTYRDTWHPNRPVVFEVVGEEGPVFHVERRIDGDTIRFSISVEAGSVFVHRTSLGEFTPPFEEFRLPPIPGKAWTYRGRFGDLDVEVRSRVVSRTGNRCEIYEEASHAGETTFTLEKGKGVVRLGGKQRDPHTPQWGDLWNWELVSFERRR